MLMWIRNMIRRTGDHPRRSLKGILWNLFSLLVTVAMMYALVFDLIPAFARHDFRKLPDGFFYFSIMIMSFLNWYGWSTAAGLFAKILAAITIFSLIASMVSGIVIYGMDLRYTLPLFFMIVFAIIIAAGVIWDRVSPDKTDDHGPAPDEGTGDE